MNRAPDVEKLVEAGLTRFEGSKDWQELGREPTFIGKALDLNPVTKAGNDALWKVIEKGTDWIFSKLGNGYKFKFTLDTLDYLRRKFPDVPDEQLAQIAATHGNDVFGGLNEKVIGNNPLWVHAQRLMLLARDWTMSNLRLAAKGFKGGPEGDLGRKYWAYAMAKTITATTVLNLAMSLGDDKSNWERYKMAWKAGELRWLDADITPLYRLACKVTGMEPSEARKYLRVGGHFYDVLKMVLTPTTFVHHKLSVLGKYMYEAGTGRDWRGRPFTTFSEFTGLSGNPEEAPLKGTLTREPKRGDRMGPVQLSQVPSYAAHQARQSLPIPAQNAITTLMGEMDGFDAVIKSGGAILSSKRPTTEAQDLMREIKAASTPTGTPAQQQAAREKFQLIEMGRKGKEKEFFTGLAEGLKMGKYTVKQALNIFKASLQDRDNVSYKTLRLNDALRVYEVGDEGERQKFAPLLLQKFGRDREGKAEAVPKMLEYAREIIEKDWVSPEDAARFITNQK